jgi:hypothetical protein
VPFGHVWEEELVQYSPVIEPHSTEAWDFWEKKDMRENKNTIANRIEKSFFIK